MGWFKTYTDARKRLSDNPGQIVKLEREARDFLLDALLTVAPAIERDWGHAHDTLPYWIEAAPKQRGRQPRNQGVPWIEVAEYVPMSHMAAELGRRFGNDAVFPGLPTGGDLRFSLEKVLVHLDGKAAGPNDRHDEVVVPPYQLSGDGAVTKTGQLAPKPSILNSALTFPGRNKSGTFYPSLPPIYTYADHTKMCVTAFLKVVYDVHSLGDQPLDHMTLAVVPNGILLHDEGLAQVPLLFARGKDDTSKPARDRRCRVMFDALAGIDAWRVTRIEKQGNSWTDASW